ncbi:hypothetical protein F4809DRAFT_637694 [Biscogniauxia mediterranea]|nr:hypothetical protein F4809DRAFT_637694 [Biscogniauxia mediterranea]
MPGYKVGHKFTPRPSGRVEADRVALHYSKTTESHGPRKTYLVGDDGELIETGLQYKVVSFDQPEPGIPELDNDEDITAEVESSRGSSLDSELDAVCAQLTDEDRMLMEEFGMTEEEFAEYISDVDSFGTASSDRSSVLSVETDANDDAPVETTVSPAAIKELEGAVSMERARNTVLRTRKRATDHKPGRSHDPGVGLLGGFFENLTLSTSSSTSRTRWRRGPRALPKLCRKEVLDYGYVKDYASGLLASG